MTNELSVEEVVELLKEKRMEINYQVNGTTRFSKALDMAIKALEQQPSEDCVSRDEVLRHRHVVQNNDWIGCCVVRVDEIIKLPSVTPKPKTGHWIRRDYWSEGAGMGESYGYYYQCSECEKIIQDGYIKCDSKYCPDCGAKMEVEENDK